MTINKYHINKTQQYITSQNNTSHLNNKKIERKSGFSSKSNFKRDKNRAQIKIKHEIFIANRYLC